MAGAGCIAFRRRDVGRSDLERGGVCRFRPHAARADLRGGFLCRTLSGHQKRNRRGAAAAAVGGARLPERFSRTAGRHARVAAAGRCCAGSDETGQSMKTSTDRILTTHTGSLPRPKPLIDLILRREKGEAIAADTFEAEVVKAVDSVVAQQVAAGIDVVSDGEMSKPSYTTYIRHRVTGIAPDPRAAEKGIDIMIGRDLLAHPDFGRRGNFSAAPFPGCVGELRYKDRSALDRDLAHLKAAAAKSKPTEVFMTAPSPGILTRFIINLHY